MKVLKFGGTSVGTIESLLNVRRIVESLSLPAVVVVSALGGLTDRLIAMARKAASGDDSYKEDMEGVRRRHHDIVEGVVPEANRQRCLKAVNPLLEELSRLYDGVRLIGDLPGRTLDHIVSFGERVSSIIVAEMIAGASHVNSLDVIKTEKWFGKNIADAKLTEENILNHFHPETGKPVVTGGFISTDRDSGEITNLGRGGSDYTAALIAAALDAEVLEIWTDVDGFMTSDPRIIPEARIIPNMSFVESMELCSYGAKVIYPPTIYPVFHKNIPIRILNTFNPSAPGTLIKDFTRKDLSGESRIRGISALKDMALLSLKGPLAHNIAAISSRTFNTLAKKGITVFLVSQTDDNDAFSFALRESDIADATALIRSEFAPELASGLIRSVDSSVGLSIVAIVGEDILSEGFISPRISNTLQRSGVQPAALSEGGSKSTVTFAVNREHTDLSLRLIHSLFF